MCRQRHRRRARGGDRSCRGRTGRPVRRTLFDRGTAGEHNRRPADRVGCARDLTVGPYLVQIQTAAGGTRRPERHAMQRLARQSLYSALLLLVALLVGVTPVAAQLDLAAMSKYMEQAWNGANWPVALALLDQMRLAWPDDQGLIDRQARGHLNYGWDLLSSGQCGEAYGQFERALGLLPGDGEVQQGLALTRERCPQDIPLRASTPVARDASPTQPAEHTGTIGAVDRPTRYVVRSGDTL